MNMPFKIYITIGQVIGIVCKQNIALWNEYVQWDWERCYTFCRSCHLRLVCKFILEWPRIDVGKTIRTIQVYSVVWNVWNCNNTRKYSSVEIKFI